MYETLETLFHRLSKHHESRQVYFAVHCIFNSLPGVWTSRWNVVSRVWMAQRSKKNKTIFFKKWASTGCLHVDAHLGKKLEANWEKFVATQREYSETLALRPLHQYYHFLLSRWDVHISISYKKTVLMWPPRWYGQWPSDTKEGQLRRLSRRERGGGVGVGKVGWWGVAHLCQNPYPIYDQNLWFLLPNLWPKIWYPIYDHCSWNSYPKHVDGLKMLKKWLLVRNLANSRQE